jgi:capsule biosynthesis phosphatase
MTNINQRRIVIDLDETICFSKNGDYGNSTPNTEVIEKIREMKNEGFFISIFTARNMATYKGNINKINELTLPIILTWLNKHSVPYDEVIVGKPWCGSGGFYVDDKAIRPNEFVKLSLDQIKKLVNA